LINYPAIVPSSITVDEGMALEMLAPYSGIILTGGSSRRMGRDKLSLPLLGRPLIYWAADCLKGAGEIIAAGGRGPQCFPEALWVPDSFPGSGPTAGIHAGLKAAKHAAAFVVAGDMPFVPAAFVEWVLGELGDGDAVFPLFEGRVPVCGAFSTACCDVVEDFLRSGERKLTLLLNRLDVKYIDGGKMADTFPGNIFINVNTPEELKQAEQIALSGHLRGMKTC